MIQIVFASDFGSGTESVGTCHAVMAAIAPNTRVIDLTHTLTPFDVKGASIVLADILPFSAPSVGVLVVDPGVGSQRRPIAVRCGRGDMLVGPDNGLLMNAATPLGAILAARELTNARYHGESQSKTFHARDIFCPVAAHLSLGADFNDLGQALNPQELVVLEPPHVEISQGRIVCEVINIDRFGNARLPIKSHALTQSAMSSKSTFKVSAPSGQAEVRRVPTYSDLATHEIGLLEDSFGWLCLVTNRRSAAEAMNIMRGTIVSLK